MTIQELYEWAVEYGLEEFSIEIRHRDGGGYYDGRTSLRECDIDIDWLRKEVIV